MPAPFIPRPSCVRWARSLGEPLTSSRRVGRPTGVTARTRTGFNIIISFRLSLSHPHRTCSSCTLVALNELGIDPDRHDLRFVEDDWESPTLGAWGLGWEVWCDGMEVSQFTYFQQVGSFECRPISGELTYGLERLAMYVLGVENVYELPFNDPASPTPLTYGDIFLQAEKEYSTFNFEVADTAKLIQHFEDAERECAAILEHQGSPVSQLAMPAYDQCLKASHLFNLLDARGAISVAERQAYIRSRPRARPALLRSVAAITNGALPAPSPAYIKGCLIEVPAPRQAGSSGRGVGTSSQVLACLMKRGPWANGRPRR